MSVFIIKQKKGVQSNWRNDKDPSPFLTLSSLCITCTFSPIIATGGGGGGNIGPK